MSFNKFFKKKEFFKVKKNGARLNGIIVGNKVEILPYGIYCGKGLKKVAFKKGVERICEWAFAHNEIESIYLPESLRIVDAYAFRDNCIENVSLNKGLEIVKHRSFADNKIQSLVLPNSLRVVGNGAFADNEISNFRLNFGLEIIEEKAFENNKLTKIVIPCSVKEVSAFAFANNMQLISAVVSAKTDIAKNAFYGCVNLEEVICNGVNIIEEFELGLDFYNNLGRFC